MLFHSAYEAMGAFIAPGIPCALSSFREGSTHHPDAIVSRVCGIALSELFDGVDGPRSRHKSAKTWSSVNATREEPSMGEVSTIGLDLAKHVFQVHGVDEQGNVTVRKPLRRGAVLKFFAELSPCTIGIEACSTAHYWARELTALGHSVRLMPPAYVKPYVK